ncbi:MAG TPA: TolC family protein [Rickettsiales bacterium]|nr:TolC family protein [Rickettsiales bacterium]
MQFENTEARTASARVRRARLEHTIAVLIGKPPAEFSLKSQKFSAHVPDIPVGLPSTLLERCPDIAAAERKMAAANAQIGVATAAWFPDLPLSASIGYDSMSLSKLFAASGEFWAIGPQLAETAFDAGAREARIRQKRATPDTTMQATKCGSRPCTYEGATSL